MISFLQGKIILKKEKFIILEVNNIGYKVFLSKKSILMLPEAGQGLKLFIFMDVKETSQNLYGFFGYQDLDFFEMLNNIRGIGPKVAIEIASLGPLDKLKDRILSHDDTIFETIPGIGQKRAMSIILELTGKIKNVSKAKSSAGEEAEDTLVDLGFPRQKAKEALAQVPKNIKSPQERLKVALQIIGKA